MVEKHYSTFNANSSSVFRMKNNTLVSIYSQQFAATGAPQRGWYSNNNSQRSTLSARGKLQYNLGTRYCAISLGKL
jgi:hypothetical protein